MLFTLELLHRSVLETKQLCVAHSVLSVRHLFELGLLLNKFFLDALFTKWLFLKHHNWFREVNLTQIHLNCVCEKWLHRHLSPLALLWATCLVSKLAVCLSCGIFRVLYSLFFSLIDHFLTSKRRSSGRGTKSWEI